MKKWILAVMIVIAPLSAQASRGEIVLYPSGCDYYIVDADLGFAVLEWYGGNDPFEGDVIVGDFESYGMKNIYNLTRGSETRVWVEDYMLSRDSAIETLYDKCN